MHSQTHATLLDRLREGSDPLAWEGFYERCWRLIYATARRRDRRRGELDAGTIDFANTREVIARWPQPRSSGALETTRAAPAP